ncbi:putative peptidase YtmA [Kurthia sibirica]|nr:putative peptidase YtmA [Kurthia sibirica]
MKIVNGDIFFKRVYPSPNPHVQLTEITYWSEGLLVKGMLAEPIVDGNYEGILYLRGGIQSIGMVRPARIAQFASQGFVVFAPYYRGNRGGQGKDEFAGADRYDAIAGVDVLKKYCSSQRIHLYAFSRGGIMALWTAIKREDITSLVTWGGVSDVELTYKERVDMRRMMKRVIGGTPSRVPENYEARSALKHLDELTIPVLIIHGELDDHVQLSHAQLLENALKKQSKKVETWYYPDLNHYFPGQLNQEVVAAALQWMKAQ